MTPIKWTIYVAFALLIIPVSATIMAKFDKTSTKLAIGAVETVVCALVMFAIQAA